MVSDASGSSFLENGNAIVEGQYGIKATSKECSVFSGIVSSDTEAPTVVQNVKAADKSYNKVKLVWDEAADNVGVTGYNIYKNGELVEVSQTNSVVVEHLKANKEYTFTVTALDAAGNESEQSSEINVKTSDSNDKEAPTVPTEVSAKPSKKSVALTWKESTDNIGVEYYVIYVDGKKTATTQKNSFTVTQLNEETEYTFEVSAVDDAGNESDKSAPVKVATISDATEIDPGIIKDYDTWYVGKNGADKASVAKLTTMESGGLEMSFDLQQEMYPCFQVDPEEPVNLNSYKTMTFVVTNNNLKAIQVVPIIKDDVHSSTSWKELCNFVEIMPKTTKVITVPCTCEEASHVERFALRVQSGSGGVKGTVQLHSISLGVDESKFDAAVAELNRPKSADYYAWDYSESTFSQTKKSGIEGEKLFIDYAGVTDSKSAGISTKNNPMITTGQDWSGYSSVSATITNKGTTPIHVSLVLRTGSNWTWQESGGLTDDSDDPERIIQPGESVDVVYDFNKPIWKSEETNWEYESTLKESDSMLCTQFKIYRGKGEAAADGSVEITNFSVNF